MKYSLINFFKMESAVGILLIIATILAMLMANSPLANTYELMMDTPVVVMFGQFSIAKPLLLWINDGLMALFFFMVGLEIKREVVEGSLSDKSKLAIPAFAAFGGMLVPALVYVYFNWGNEATMQGWAIPMATDIAFALGVLSLLGKRVPMQLKVFLLALAIIDDLGAIIVIAIFYTSHMSFLSLGIAVIMILALFIMNKNGVVNNTAYILVGIVLWTAVLKSGVHATLAGVILGLMIPIKGNKESFHKLEHSLYAPVNFVILPLFAFANAGIGFSTVGLKDFTDSMTVGIVFGLFIGKQVGVLLFTFIANQLRLGSLPEGVTWGSVYGLAILSGIGFTMSLFIGSLAFECHEGVCYDLVDYRMGILLGSFISGVIGYLVLLKTLPKV
ncbi:MAG TPA: Na+/H+ antiporter NhaA [Sulfurimonas sp.]|nr:Na+/H+ antiporter NhaA [Sulfurimonas sp.]